MSFASPTVRLVLAGLAMAVVAASCTNDDGPAAEGVPASSTTAPADGDPTDPEDPADPGDDETGGRGPGQVPSGGVTVEETTPSPEPSAEELALLADLPGRLAVGAAGALTVLAPDGTEVDVLAADAAVIAAQPAWSSDGARLVWSRSTAGGHELVFTPIDVGADGDNDDSAAEEGSGLGETAISAAPGPPAFYLQWSATGDRVAYLRNDPGGRGVELGTAVPGQAAVPLLATAPVFISWSVGGPELAAHLGARQVARLEFPPVAGPEPAEPAADDPAEQDPAQQDQADQDPADEDEATEEETVPRPAPQAALQPTGQFTTPDWIDDRTLVVVSPEGLALLDIRTGQTELLVEAEEEVRFVVSPDRRRIAYHLPELSGAVSTVALVQAQEPTERVGGLVVLDIDTGDMVPVSPSNPLSFEWSPDGQGLAWLSSGPGGSGGSVGWSFWDGQTVTEAERYRISDREAVTMLPFFEQYAPSHSRWSPDGRAFVFAGIVDGQPDGVASGVWVHLVGQDVPAVRVATGDLAIWSP